MRIASLVLYPDSSCGFCAAKHNNLKLARFGSPPRFGAAGRRPHLRARERPRGKPKAGVISERGCVKSRPRSTSAHARARRHGSFWKGVALSRGPEARQPTRGHIFMVCRRRIKLGWVLRPLRPFGGLAVGAPCPRALQLSRADHGPQQGLKLLAGHVARRGRPTQGFVEGASSLAGRAWPMTRGMGQRKEALPGDRPRAQLFEKESELRQS